MEPINVSDRGRRVLGDRKPQVQLESAIQRHELSKNKFIKAVGVSRQAMQSFIYGTSRPREAIAQRVCEVLEMAWEDVWTYERKAEVSS